MRVQYPEELLNMLEQQKPYLHYVKGRGLVLADDAPEEIVIMREKTLEMVKQIKFENMC